MQLQQIFGVISLLGSLLVLLSLYFCTKWRQRMPSVKSLLFVMSLFNAIRAANYLYHADESSDALCRLQASMMQVFAIGSSLYAFCMALETNILLGLITRKNPERDQLSMDNPETRYRHMAYHCVVNGYGVAVTIWMNAAGEYGQSGTPWCYFAAPKYRVFCAYIPIWVAITGIIVLDVAVIRKTLASYRLLARSRSRSASSSLSQDTGGPGQPVTSVDVVSDASGTSSVFRTPQSDTQMSHRMIRLIIRMILYPIALMLLLVPGFILRLCDWTGECHFSGALYWSLAKIQRVCDPSAGIVIAVIWVISDLNVREEWAKVLRPCTRRCCFWRHPHARTAGRGLTGRKDPRSDETVTSTTEMSRMEPSSGQSSSVMSKNMHYVTDNDDSVFASHSESGYSDDSSSFSSEVGAPWKGANTK